MLIAPGASLGGARPKASVTDEKGHLWIAKFPSVTDTTNVGAWEMLVAELALDSDIIVAQGTIRKLSNKYDTFLSKRFDRTDDGGRFHFASATDLALSVAGYFRLTGSKAKDIITQTKKAVSKWPALANKYQIPRQEQEQMSTAFQLAMK